MTKGRGQEGTALIPRNLQVAEDCRAVSEVLARVGDKWTVLVVGVPGEGPKRFNELRRALGRDLRMVWPVFQDRHDRPQIIPRAVENFFKLQNPRCAQPMPAWRRSCRRWARRREKS
jgi:hypothetical protein